MQQLIEVLEGSRRTGEIIEIVYWGGTQPGTRRDLYAIKLNPPLVLARCLENNELRSFRIDRMVLVDETNRDAPRYQVNKTPVRIEVPPPARRLPARQRARVAADAGLAQLADGLRAALPGERWHVLFAGTGKAPSIAVYARFKNGNPHRTVTRSITVEAGVYLLRGKGVPNRTFRSLDKAARTMAVELDIPAESAVWAPEPNTEQVETVQPAAAPPPALAAAPVQVRWARLAITGGALAAATVASTVIWLWLLSG